MTKAYWAAGGAGKTVVRRSERLRSRLKATSETPF